MPSLTATVNRRVRMPPTPAKLPLFEGSTSYPLFV
jgi:hypothetical protein